MFVSFLNMRDSAGFQHAIEAILSGSNFESVWEPNDGVSVADLWASFTRSR